MLVTRLGRAAWVVLVVSFGPHSVAADCNANGVEDAVEIAGGASADCNSNGVPDECDVALGFALRGEYPLALGSMYFEAWPRDTGFAAGDLDGDGDPDLVAANSGAGGATPPPAGASLSVLRNRGDGSYEPEVLFATGRSPLGVAIADLDGDGDLDIVTANAAEAPSLLLNRGDGSFDPPASLPLSLVPLEVAAADLDGDGDVDLAAMSHDGVRIVLNSGDAVFAEGPYLEAVHGGERQYLKDIAVADLDGDGDVDVAASDRSVLVWRNSGNAGFSSPAKCSPGADGMCWTHALVAVDLDGDRRPDLATANYTDGGTPSISILANRGDGAFADGTTYYFASFHENQFIAGADFDLDGDVDFAAAIGDEVCLVRNDGSGRFSEPWCFAIEGDSSCLLATDADLDGRPDLVVKRWRGDDRRDVLVFESTTASADSDGNGVPDECEARSVLIGSGEAWRFIRGTGAPPPAWRDVGFDDGGWEVGVTGIGYGDADDATVLDDMRGSYLGIFCRKTFQVADPAAASGLVLQIDYDDGFIAYLNGAEVARANMGAGDLHLAFDAAAVSAREPGRMESFQVAGGGAILRAGANVLAVQVHNSSVESSDLTFIPRLVCAMEPPSPGPVPPVVWEATLGGARETRGSFVSRTADGGFIAIGETSETETESSDAYLARLAPDGRLLWEGLHGGSRAESGHAVRETADGGFICAGMTASFPEPGDDELEDVYLFRTDAGGCRLWQRSYGGPGTDYGYGVIEMAGGDLAVGGTLDGKAYLLRTSSSGDLLWERSYPVNVAFSLEGTQDGGFLLAGVTSVEGRSLDPYILKADATGDLVWVRTFGGPYYDSRCHASGASDGGFVVTGSTGLGADFGEQAFLIRTDATGTPLWQRTFGGIGQDYGFSARELLDGGIAVVGLADSGTPSSSAWILETDPAGNLLWEKKIGGTGDDILRSVAEASDGGLVVVGAASIYSTIARPDSLYMAKVGPGAAPEAQIRVPVSYRSESSATVPVYLRARRDQGEVRAFSLGLGHDPTRATIEDVAAGPDVAAAGGADFFHADTLPPACSEAQAGVTVAAILSLEPPLRSLPAEVALEVVELTYRGLVPGPMPLRFVSCLGDPDVRTVVSGPPGSLETDARDGRIVFGGGASFLRGDATADGALDISDPVALLYLLFRGEEVPCFAACDANGQAAGADGESVDLSDAVYLLLYLFLHGSPPAAPFPECGHSVGVSCDRYDACP